MTNDVASIKNDIDSLFKSGIEVTNPHIYNLRSVVDPQRKKVKSKESVGSKHTMDLEIEQETHSYWANGTPVHNTINVPTDTPFEEFQNIYLYAYEKGLKGCTTFRFNPEAFQGVLVTEDNLKNTTYQFTLDNGEVVEGTGDEKVLYDGEEHTIANLYDALKEGYYGKF